MHLFLGILHSSQMVEIEMKLVIGHPLLPGHLVPLLLYLLDPHLIEQADEGSDVIINRYFPVSRVTLTGQLRDLFFEHS